MKTIAAQLEQAYPATNKGWSATVVPSIDQSVGTIRPALMILLAGIAFVLVMASVNVANLLLARSIAREKELATRAALGAGRARIARQLLTESLLFAARRRASPACWSCGGRCTASSRSRRPICRASNEVSDRLARAAGGRRSPRMLTGVLVGVLPALSSASVSPQASLQDAQPRHGRRRAAPPRPRRRSSSPKSRSPSRSPPAPCLLLRSFVSVTNVNPGFDTTQLLTWQMNLPQHLTDSQPIASRSTATSSRAWRRCPAWSRSAARRACRSAARRSRRRVQIEGPSGAGRRAARSAVPPRDAQLLRRRWAFRSAAAAASIRTTAPTAPPVAVINETMAQQAVPEPGSDRPARPHRPERRPAHGRPSSA